MLPPIQREELIIISDQQKNAATNIICEFMNNKRWCLLNAQMQSGKTSTYCFVAAEMIRMRHSDYAVIFSGNNEVQLRVQMKDTLRDFIISYRRYLKTYDICAGDDVDADYLCDYILSRNIEVCCGNDMKHYDCKPNTMYIWDESHYAQNKQMRPNKFLDKIGISANGNCRKLTDKNSFMLSVSATPFSEFCANHHLNQEKSVVHLNVSPGYYGVEKMMQNGLIKFFDVSNYQTELVSLMERHRRNPPKYGLLRIHNDHVIDEIKTIILSCGWSYLTFYSSTQTTMKMASMNELETAPENHTIVLLKEKCRMGKVVPKQHIAFCMETSKHPKIDTVLQSLLGRMCGYHNYNNIEIYLTNEILLDELQQYILYTKQNASTQINDIVVPSNANNVTQNRTETTCLYFTTIPIRIKNFSQLASETWGENLVWGQNQNYLIKRRITRIFMRILSTSNTPEWLENYNNEIQFNEIVERIVMTRIPIECNDSSCRTYGPHGPHESVSNQLLNMVETKTPGKTVFCGGRAIGPNELKVVIWKVGDDLYIETKTVQLSSIPTTQSANCPNIPCVKSKSVFNIVSDSDSDDEEY